MHKQIPYTEADIMRYLNGTMTPADMHQLELQALDDEFLQDAIDGYRLLWEENQKAIPLMAEKLLAENTKAPVASLLQRKTWRYAVAAMLLMGVGYGVYDMTQPKKNLQSVTPQLVAKVDVPPTIPVPADSAQLPFTAPELNTPFGTSSSNSNNNAALAEVKSTTVPTYSQFYAVTPPGTKTDSVAAVAMSKANGDMDGDGVTDQFDVEKNTPLPSKESRADSIIVVGNLANNKVAKKPVVISGTIVDEDNKSPLDNISLRVKGGPAATVSDRYGHFKIATRDTTATLIASGNGYASLEFRANASNERLQVNMQPSNRSLNNIPVDKYANGKRKAAAAKPAAKVFAETNAKEANQFSIDTASASPIGGWQNFTRYLRDNSQIPPEPGKTYSVDLLFEVGDDGELLNIEVIHADGKKYEAEAIRLLKAGPRWDNKTGTRAEVTITVEF